MGWFRKRSSSEVAAPLLLSPFYDRWREAPTSRKIIEESARWQVVHYLVDDSETKWAILNARWANDPKGKGWLVRLYLTDCRLVMCRLASSERVDFGSPCFNFPFEEVIGIRPNATRPLEYLLDFVTPFGGMEFTLVFSGAEKSAPFIYSLTELFGSHGGVHGEKGNPVLRQALAGDG